MLGWRMCCRTQSHHDNDVLHSIVDGSVARQVLRQRLLVIGFSCRDFVLLCYGKAGRLWYSWSRDRPARISGNLSKNCFGKVSPSKKVSRKIVGLGKLSPETVPFEKSVSKTVYLKKSVSKTVPLPKSVISHLFLKIQTFGYHICYKASFPNTPSRKKARSTRLE